MERKTWVMPMTLVQKFDANEVVALCWGVGCDTDLANASNSYDSTHPQWHPDDPGHVNNWGKGYLPRHGTCGNSSNQYFKDTNGDGAVDALYERAADGTELLCEIYSDASYTNTISVENVQPNSTIYWTSSAATNLPWPNPKTATWHHVGTTFDTVPGHPNRS